MKTYKLTIRQETQIEMAIIARIQTLKMFIESSDGAVRESYTAQLIAAEGVKELFSITPATRYERQQSDTVRGELPPAYKPPVYRKPC